MALASPEFTLCTIVRFLGRVETPRVETGADPVVDRSKGVTFDVTQTDTIDDDGTGHDHLHETLDEPANLAGGDDLTDDFTGDDHLTVDTDIDSTVTQTLAGVTTQVTTISHGHDHQDDHTEDDAEDDISLAADGTETDDEHENATDKLDDSYNDNATVTTRVTGTDSAGVTHDSTETDILFGKGHSTDRLRELVDQALQGDTPSGVDDWLDRFTGGDTESVFVTIDGHDTWTDEDGVEKSVTTHEENRGGGSDGFRDRDEDDVSYNAAHAAAGESQSRGPHRVGEVHVFFRRRQRRLRRRRREAVSRRSRPVQQPRHRLYAHPGHGRSRQLRRAGDETVHNQAHGDSALLRLEPRADQRPRR